MQVPLYQAKAEFFRMLGHPVRIRVLELLGEGPRPVRDLLTETGVEASNLSQQLAVLRRAGIVVSTRDGANVVYALAGPDVADLMRAARRILTEMLQGQAQLLASLTVEPMPGPTVEPTAGLTVDAAPGPSAA
ncbi:metalloregulator ArsR/SmtB family transcription factor [Plantactinospora sp. B5E13]|uniref:ArsR/SmtB family transcription factor n=1 Tax=Plantactinospora sp. B5E13 TaxID=3153758 RepID=UPI00325EF685